MPLRAAVGRENRLTNVFTFERTEILQILFNFRLMLMFESLVSFEIFIHFHIIGRIVLNPSSCSADSGLGINDRRPVQ